MAEIYIHPSLIRFTNNQNKIELSVSTIDELIPTLCQMFPQLKGSILNEAGELTPYVNCYINGKNLNSYAERTPLMADAKIDIVTAMVGG
ncbi:MoaD/ThiS family protein [Legionella oakridgensis]|uniref:ThiS family protein n=1 Tax=Legionella oakridgensis TaxID=29423 RepID=A0A0W0WXM7_9GAMM|nr:MoaD/ThiS family protein [Legionella oakridgensis]ETO92809.1 ThiS family [Legionella oakridgensis RV-2-2007]KTD37085.1 ThiS family protein [Legionella oakridgensis]STY20606.1 MoaD family protein [Legionella longbeachae]